MLDRDYDIEAGAYEAVIDQVRRSIPCVIVDLPHAWTPWARQTLLAADEIVVVATPDLASLRNTKNMLDVIRGRRPNDTPPNLVINQVGMPKRPEIPIKDFAEAIDLQPALVLPFDPQLFGTAANNGQMIAEVQPASASAEGIRKLAGLHHQADASATWRRRPSCSFLPFISQP